jgi:hypothetical protein
MREKLWKIQMVLSGINGRENVGCYESNGRPRSHRNNENIERKSAISGAFRWTFKYQNYGYATKSTQKKREKA